MRCSRKPDTCRRSTASSRAEAVEVASSRFATTFAGRHGGAARLRPPALFASLDDHARMLAALGREEDAGELRTVRRLIELECERGLALEQ